ncbi:MAG: HAMP domain-containing sensor histidine kinase [bacterium]|nr:HAMP domain-containing sensor histidine kinase [bacterium]
MKLLDEVLISSILIMFPLLIYLFYVTYKNITNHQEKDIYFALAIFTSLYLSIKYTFIDSRIIIMLNILILLSYIKQKEKIAYLVSIILVGYSYFYTNINIYILIIMYISFAITYYLSKQRKFLDNKFLSIIATLQGFFITLEYFYRYTKANDINIIFSLFIIITIFYTVSFLLLYLFNKADEMLNLHSLIHKLEQEKEVKNSLFKVTHEVKNPVAVIKGYLDMFDIKDEEKSKRYINIMKGEVNRSINIMNDFLDLSKIKIKKEILDINLIVEEIEDSLSIMASNKNIECSSTYIDDEIYVMGDENRLKQVLINIIKNSIESILNKGKIEIQTKTINNNYIISIIDNGCGMDEETLSKINEMFFTTKKNGTGLGIVLSNEIIKAHGGTISFISKENIGTTVNISLPIYNL